MERDALEHARISFSGVSRPQDRFRYDRDVGPVHWFGEGRDGSFECGGHDLDHLGISVFRSANEGRIENSTAHFAL
jgi:hypothetical protein